MKNKNDIQAMLKEAGILFAITLIAGLLLGFVYELTKEPSQLAEGTLGSWSGNSKTLNLGSVSALDTIVVESYYPEWYGTLSAFTAVSYTHLRAHET